MNEKNKTAELMRAPEFRKKLEAPVRIDSSHDVPYVAGYSEDGKTIYFDRHYKPDLDGTDTKKFILIHEKTEKALIDLHGYHYLEAHKAATLAEKAAVKKAGLDWKAYSGHVDGQLKGIEHEKLLKLPEDLDLTPYKDSQDFGVLKAIKEKHVNEDYASTLKYHIRLNPKIWQMNNKLRPEIKTKLMQFAKLWQTFASIPNAAVVDVIMTGGNANFNYTQFSDIDVHIVVDPKKLGWGGSLRDQVQAKKKQWSITHKNKVLDYPLEPYAQDQKDKFPKGQGVYSIMKDIWLQEPVWQTGMDFQRDPILKQKVQHYMDIIDDAIKHKMSYSAVEEIKSKLKDMRSAAISKNGEFAPENLVFKELRNQGYLDKLSAYTKSVKK